MHNRCFVISLLAVGCLALAAPLDAHAKPRPAKGDRDGTRLAAARKYVQASGRYMHHSRLKRGMKGYGLSVFAGTKIERFDVEILSVMRHFGPHQDVVLAKVSGHGLEKSGVIAGMSGSPIYIKDPKDGKDKIIGALAYGWNFQVEPICGIQPITQMVAVPGFLPESAAPADRKRARSEPAPASPGRAVQEAFLRPEKIDFAALALKARAERLGLTPPATAAAEGIPRLRRLQTPLMVSAAGPGLTRRAAAMLAPLGLVPLRSGAAGAADAKAAGGVKLEPGSSLAIQLVAGDADWTAVGTVTDVVDGRVLGFGHSFFAEGPLAVPMGTGYIHTVISSQSTSFKLGSTLGITGALETDEMTAVFGRRGAKAAMVPMHVTVRFPAEDRVQEYNYRLARHSWLTASLASMMIGEAVYGWRYPPEEHTVEYSVEVDFGEFGTVRTANVMADSGAWPAASDLTRPIMAMEYNPFGPPIRPTKIRAEVTILPKSRANEILDLQLAGDTYRPGETVRGELIVRPNRSPRKSLPVAFELPEDLPEGTYTLNALDASNYLYTIREEQRYRFTPTSRRSLLEALRAVVQPRGDTLYLHLAVPEGGVAIKDRALPDLPASKAQIIAEARKLDASAFGASIVRARKGDRVYTGSASANFTVKRKIDQTLIRQEKP